MKQNVKALKGIVPSTEVVLAGEFKGTDVPVQTCIVRATLDKTGRKDKQDYKGYMLLFTELNKVVPVNAGDILLLQEKSGRQLFEVTEEGHLLTHFEFGLTDGKLSIAE